MWTKISSQEIIWADFLAHDSSINQANLKEATESD